MSKHLTHTKDFNKDDILRIFTYANEYLDKKKRDDLKGHLIINVFFENSTRTRSSFEIAAKRLGADVVNLDVARSSTAKGETLFDTAANLDAMGPSAIVVRHNRAGVPKILSKYVKSSIINAGDGAHQHPTQGLLDLFTLIRKWGDLKGKKIAIVGDIRNSRVANSDIELFRRFQAEVLLVGPPHFLPKSSLPKTHNLKEAIEWADAVISLRTQTERHSQPSFASLQDYAENFQITKDLIKDKNILIMHPGPVHRNIDISDEVLADERCLVLEQVKNGVAVRMGILKFLIEN